MSYFPTDLRYPQVSNIFVSTTLSSGKWGSENTGEAAKPVHASQQAAIPTLISDWAEVTQLRTALS